MIDDDRRMKVDENGGCCGWWDVVWYGVAWSRKQETLMRGGLLSGSEIAWVGGSTRIYWVVLVGKLTAAIQGLRERPQLDLLQRPTEAT